MPIFTMIISTISGILAAALKKDCIIAIGICVGIVADIIFQIILAIKDRNKPEPSFIIDYRRTGYSDNEWRYKMAVSKHTRKGKPRRHTNGTFGAHVNGKRIGKPRRHTNGTTGSHMNDKKIDSKINSKNKLHF